LPRTSTGHPHVLGSSPDPRTAAPAASDAVPPQTAAPPALGAADVDRLLATVSALTAAHAEQARELSRLLDLLERLTVAHDDAVHTVARLEARLAGLELRADAESSTPPDEP